MTDLQKERICDWYDGKGSANKIRIFFSENPDIEKTIREQLKSEPYWDSCYQICRAIYEGIVVLPCCHFCGKKLHVTKYLAGKRFCSVQCSANSVETREKQRQTNLKKYGCVSPLQNADVRKKTESTCLERFNNKMFAGSESYKKKVKSPFNQKNTRDKSIKTKVERYGNDFGKVIFDTFKDKLTKTNQQNHGVDYLLQSPDILKKTQESRLKKYGNDHFWGSDELIRRKRDFFYDSLGRWSDYVEPLFNREEYVGWDKEYLWRCVKCGYEFKQKIYTTGLGGERCAPRCLKCYPFSCSLAESQLICFLIDDFKLDILTHDRTLIKPYELDIVIHSQKIAIEFDGLYWHSEERRGENYHLKKTELCEKQGYRLIHIFEDEWLNKQEIVKSRLKSIFGLDQTRIYARKTEVKEITAKESCLFLNENHLQGDTVSLVKLGLFYQEELVAVMTFGKPRFNKNYEWELLRFATKQNIIGGASKLLKYFERNYNPQTILTYADRRWSVGDLYKKIGFGLIRNTTPNYWWVFKNSRLSRYACQRHKLSKMFNESYSSEMSERDIMELNGCYKIYDCGNLVFAREYK